MAVEYAAESGEVRTIALTGFQQVARLAGRSLVGAADTSALLTKDAP
ncbi:hypothetical protein [Streptomyces sp. NPDC001568]